MTTTKTQPEPRKEIAPVSNNLIGEVLLPSSSDEKILKAFERYQELKKRLLENEDYTHFVKWQLGDGKPQTKGFALLADAEKHAADMKKKGFSVTQERRIKKSGVLKLSKAFCVSTEILSETLIGTSGITYRVRATAPNGQSQERTGSCDRGERGRDGSPWDHIVAIALTRACNRSSMALLGGESTAEEFVDDDAPAEAKPVKSTVVEEKRPEQKTEAEIKADLDKAFSDKKPAAPTNERNELLKRLFGAAKRAGMSDEKLRIQMENAYKVKSTKDLPLVDLEGFTKGIEEYERIVRETANQK
jgi:hypothetical protein